MSLLQGKFGLIDKSLLKYPPFVAMEMQKQAACKCSSGYHTVWTNYLTGQDPTCSCEPDNPINNNALTQCAKLTAPKGYKYIWTENGCVLAVDYDINTEKWISNDRVFSSEISAQTGDILEKAKSFASQHKIAVGVALLALGYFAFSGGLAASDRTITSVTRYAPRRKNPTRRKKNIKRRNYKRR